MYVCMYVCMYDCVYIYTYIYIYISPDAPFSCLAGYLMGDLLRYDSPVEPPTHPFHASGKTKVVLVKVFSRIID